MSSPLTSTWYDVIRMTLVTRLTRYAGQVWASTQPGTAAGWAGSNRSEDESKTVSTALQNTIYAVGANIKTSSPEKINVGRFGPTCPRRCTYFLFHIIHTLRQQSVNVPQGSSTTLCHATKLVTLTSPGLRTNATQSTADSSTRTRYIVLGAL